MKTKCINGALGIEICDIDLNKINNATKSDDEVGSVRELKTWGVEIKKRLPMVVSLASLARKGL